MKLRLNREFLFRHLFALAVFAGFGLWFAYDGFVEYPRADARALYARIEQSQPPEGTDVDGFKANKVRIQRIFAVAILLVAAGVGVHLAAVAPSPFEWDDEGFSWRGRRHVYGEIESVDKALWERKRILRFSGRDFAVSLDAWHHAGVKEFAEKIL
jgi:hypothetical protein